MSAVLPKNAQTVFRLLRQLPPAPVPKGLSTNLITSDELRCASCNAAKHISDFASYSSGVLDLVLLPLCSSCKPVFKDCSRIVCCTCKTVIGWVDPHVDKDKFVFEKAHSYHIQACPSCQPGLSKADIIEKIIYLREIHKKII
jgi:hypothetical protein